MPQDMPNSMYFVTSLAEQCNEITETSRHCYCLSVLLRLVVCWLRKSHCGTPAHGVFGFLVPFSGALLPFL